MFRSPVLAEIENLDPVRDHQRITFLCCRVDFPGDATRALEFALFRTFCVPAISSRRCRKRLHGTHPHLMLRSQRSPVTVEP